MNNFFQILKPVTFLIFISWVQAPQFDSNCSTISNTNSLYFNSLTLEAAVETPSFLEDKEDFDKDFFTIQPRSENCHPKQFKLNYPVDKSSCICFKTFHLLFSDLPPPGLI